MAFKNIVDGTSTTVSAATPGWTVDLRNHTTARLRSVGVPVRFKICVNSTAGGDTGAVKLVDSSGSTVISCLVNNPAATSSAIGDWYWADGYIPATLAKYDVHFGGNTVGTLTPLSASLYEIDWTTDPVTGSASMTLGTMTISADGNTTNTGVLSSSLDALTITADGGFRGEASLTLDALTISGAGTVDVIGTASQTLGALTIAADGTVASNPPTFQAIGTVSTGGVGAGVSPSWPAHATDDYAILVVVQGRADGNTDPGAATLSTSAGFTAVTSGDKGSTYTDGFLTNYAVHITTFECRATSSGMSAPTVNSIANNAISAYIITFRGAKTSGSAVDVVSSSANNANDSSVSISGADPSVANTVVLAACGAAGSAASASSWTNGDLTSFTERADATSVATLTTCATGTRTADTAYGASTATLSANSTWAGVTLAIRPN